MGTIVTDGMQNQALPIGCCVNFPPAAFRAIEWHEEPETDHPGSTGTSSWKTVEWGDARIRVVRYSEGFSSDHWCGKGHIVHVVEGAIDLALEDGRRYALRTGTTFAVGDGVDRHTLSSHRGALVLIVD